MGFVGANDDGNVAVVTAATERPVDSLSGRAWFQRGINGLTAKLRARWTQGECHSHPGGAPDPSGNDVRKMHSISIDPSYRCPKPITVIAGTSGKSMRVSVSVLETGELIRPRPAPAPQSNAHDRSPITLVPNKRTT
ncbi:hypothetical protein GSF67_07005 [Agrobacterium sp. CGMCC 11546]|nr:hypothetical protein GSF67_07005 [Agrobacterium sp. CGMCC 11546]